MRAPKSPAKLETLIASGIKTSLAGFCFCLRCLDRCSTCLLAFSLAVRVDLTNVCAAGATGVEVEVAGADAGVGAGAGVGVGFAVVVVAGAETASFLISTLAMGCAVG